MLLMKNFDVFYCVSYWKKYGVQSYETIEETVRQATTTMKDGSTVRRILFQKIKLDMTIIHSFIPIAEKEEFQFIPDSKNLDLLIDDIAKFVELFTEFLANYTVDDFIEDKMAEFVRDDLECFLTDDFSDGLHFDYSIIDQQIENILSN